VQGTTFSPGNILVSKTDNITVFMECTFNGREDINENKHMKAMKILIILFLKNICKGVMY